MTINRYTRRRFLETLALSVAGAQYAVGAGTVPRAIDAHTHFYDPTRAEGVPWPPKTNELLYRPHLPKEFRELATPVGVVGTIVIEASAWLEDNQWILDLAKDEPFIVGFIGRLELGKPEFAAQLERFAANPLFRGIRIGGEALWNGMALATFAQDLKRLGDRGLTLDVLGGPESIDSALRACEAAPGLRVVLDHLPYEKWDADPAAAQRALAAVKAVPQVYAKGSNVLRAENGKLVEDAAVYAPRLDLIWEAFGSKRVLYGSNWPVSNRVGPYALVHHVVADYFTAKGPEFAAQYFWKNSYNAYAWVPRGAAADLLR